MLDHREFLKDGNQLFERLATRGVAQETMDSLSAAADLRRTSIQKLEEYRRELNTASAEMKKGCSGVAIKTPLLRGVKHYRRSSPTLKMLSKLSETLKSHWENCF